MTDSCLTLLSYMSYSSANDALFDCNRFLFSVNINWLDHVPHVVSPTMTRRTSKKSAHPPSAISITLLPSPSTPEPPTLSRSSSTDSMPPLEDPSDDFRRPSPSDKDAVETNGEAAIDKDAGHGELLSLYVSILTLHVRRQLIFFPAGYRR